MKEEILQQNLVILEKTSNGGYSAYVPELPGCIAVDSSIHLVRQRISEAIDFHLEGMKKENLGIPDNFIGDYVLHYKLDIASLFEWFSGILTKSGISKLTGMNQSLISQYVSGIKTPSTKQTKIIERALHRLGKELLEVKL